MQPLINVVEFIRRVLGFISGALLVVYLFLQIIVRSVIWLFKVGESVLIVTLEWLRSLAEPTTLVHLVVLFGLGFLIIRFAPLLVAIIIVIVLLIFGLMKVANLAHFLGQQLMDVAIPPVKNAALYCSAVWLILVTLSLVLHLLAGEDRAAITVSHKISKEAVKELIGWALDKTRK